MVLDPFGGAGTTGLVAEGLGRDSILIELNPDYADIAARRLRTAHRGIGRIVGVDISPAPILTAPGVA